MRKYFGRGYLDRCRIIVGKEHSRVFFTIFPEITIIVKDIYSYERLTVAFRDSNVKVQMK